MEQKRIIHAFKLPRAISCVNGTTGVQKTVNRKICANFKRQHNDCGLSEPTRRQKSCIQRSDDGNIYGMPGKQDESNRKTFSRNFEFQSRYPFTTEIPIRMATPSKDISRSGSNLGTTHHRQVRINEHNSVEKIQFIFRRPIYIGDRCTKPQLVRRKQLYQSTLLFDEQSNNKNSKRSSTRNSDSTNVEKPNMVQLNGRFASWSTVSDPDFTKSNVKKSIKTRAMEKPKMENIRVETMWENRLFMQGWSKFNIAQLLCKWGQSTLDSYSRYVSKYIDFMQKLGQNPEKADPAYVAKYFESVAATSDRPKSVLNSNSAALACYFDAIGCKSTITLDVRRLIEGLIKSGT